MNHTEIPTLAKALREHNSQLCRMLEHELFMHWLRAKTNSAREIIAAARYQLDDNMSALEALDPRTNSEESSCLLQAIGPIQAAANLLDACAELNKKISFQITCELKSEITELKRVRNQVIAHSARTHKRTAADLPEASHAIDRCSISRDSITFVSWFEDGRSSRQTVNFVQYAEQCFRSSIRVLKLTLKELRIIVKSLENDWTANPTAHHLKYAIDWAIKLSNAARGTDPPSMGLDALDKLQSCISVTRQSDLFMAVSGVHFEATIEGFDTAIQKLRSHFESSSDALPHEECIAWSRLVRFLIEAAIEFVEGQDVQFSTSASTNG